MLRHELIVKQRSIGSVSVTSLIGPPVRLSSIHQYMAILSQSFDYHLSFCSIALLSIRIVLYSLCDLLIRLKTWIVCTAANHWPRDHVFRAINSLEMATNGDSTSSERTSETAYVTNKWLIVKYVLNNMILLI